MRVGTILLISISVMLFVGALYCLVIYLIERQARKFKSYR